MANNNSASESLLDDEEKKRRLFWSVIWAIFALAVVLPLTSFIAPIWLMLQLVEAFLPISKYFVAILACAAFVLVSACGCLFGFFFYLHVLTYRPTFVLPGTVREANAFLEK